MRDIEDRWSELWDAQLQSELEDIRSGEYKPDQYYTSGRKSKDYPNKEDPDWWADKGPGFVRSWTNWRDASGLDIWTTPDGEPAIEIAVTAKRGELEVLSVIDRVMVDQNDRLYVLDLKSGSTTDAWPRQLALNNLGLLHTYGAWATWGGFWKARAGGIEPPDWFDLRIYEEDWLWEQVRVAKAIRDQQLFAAQPGFLCKSACGVAPYCRAVGGPLSISIGYNATLTRNERTEG